MDDGAAFSIEIPVLLELRKNAVARGVSRMSALPPKADIKAQIRDCLECVRDSA